jgi:hypothetical protein
MASVLSQIARQGMSTPDSRECTYRHLLAQSVSLDPVLILVILSHTTGRRNEVWKMKGKGRE